MANYSAHAEVNDIDVAQLKALLNQDAVVVDVRRMDEWTNTGVIDGSIPLTFFDQYGGFNTSMWMEQISAMVGEDDTVILICAAGVRSKWVADWMDTNTGYSSIYNVTEGMLGWIGQGNPVVEHQ